VTLGTLLVFPGCEGAADESLISEQLYVDTYVEILQAADEEPDEVAASERAREILARRGIGEQELVEFARRHMDDPDYLADVWRRIEARLRNPEPADSSRSEEAELHPSG
jgi:hypothetical protein